MPSAYTPLGFNKQASGENENTWGEVLNDEAIELIDTAVRGRTAFTLSGSKTLTSTNGVANEARSAILHITGGTGGTVTVPNISKPYLVINEASGAVVISAGGVNTASVAAGETAQVAVDGLAAVHKVIFSDFGGEKLRNVGNPTDAQDAATKAYADSLAFGAVDLPGQGAGTVGFVLTSDGASAEWSEGSNATFPLLAPVAAPAFTGTITHTGASKENVTAIAAADLDLSSASLFTKSISSNTTFTLSNLPVAAEGGMAFAVKLTISSAAVPSWPASVKWPGGTKPPLPNGTHLIGFLSFDDGTTWDAVLGGVAFS